MLDSPAPMALADLTRYLHSRIPLTAAMGVTVLETDPRAVLHAPLASNVNHRETAFGGSLSSLAILAGWVWLHARLAPRGGNLRLVVQESHTRFDRPVTAAFDAVCEPPTAAAYATFLDRLSRQNRARLTLESTIICNGVNAARHTGRYVALLDHKAST